MQIVVVKGVEFFRKLSKPTEEELDKAKKLIDEYCKEEFGSGADFSEFPEVELVFKNYYDKRTKIAGQAGQIGKEMMSTNKDSMMR